MTDMFLHAGKSFEGLVGPLLFWFREEHVASGIAGVMIASAIMLILGYLLLIWLPARAKLSQPIKFLEGLKKEDFPGHLDRFGSMMKNCRFLAHGWEKFREAILAHDSVVEITVRPSVFLNAADARHDGLRIHWLNGT